MSGVNNTQWKYDDDFGTELGPIEAGITGDTGQQVLYTLVFDRAAMTQLGQGELRMYRNGALVASDDAENLTILSNLAGTTSNRLGHGTVGPRPRRRDQSQWHAARVPHRLNQRVSDV